MINELNRTGSRNSTITAGSFMPIPRSATHQAAVPFTNRTMTGENAGPAEDA
ncbi:hypothetical protein [Amycolatopsis decaplanina]|uniref:hypothetical protein n=1 Tax=Amycolatopsis decaplanina TaxID=208441 RepID=UPI001378C74B|nr:hypothetical protein [Amycolatopsis decaplanina]